MYQVSQKNVLLWEERLAPITLRDLSLGHHVSSNLILNKIILVETVNWRQVSPHACTVFSCLSPGYSLILAHESIAIIMWIVHLNPCCVLWMTWNTWGTCWSWCSSERLLLNQKWMSFHCVSLWLVLWPSRIIKFFFFYNSNITIIFGPVQLSRK